MLVAQGQGHTGQEGTLAWGKACAQLTLAAGLREQYSNFLKLKFKDNFVSLLRAAKRFPALKSVILTTNSRLFIF